METQIKIDHVLLVRHAGIPLTLLTCPHAQLNRIFLLIVSVCHLLIGQIHEFMKTYKLKKIMRSVKILRF
jgi:hypothetical protein